MEAVQERGVPAVFQSYGLHFRCLDFMSGNKLKMITLCAFKDYKALRTQIILIFTSEFMSNNSILGASFALMVDAQMVYKQVLSLQ